MKYILGKKVGMIQLFDVNGRAYPGTIIHCEPNKIIEVKTADKNGYKAIKVSFDTTEEKKLNKAISGIYKKTKTEPSRKLKEFRDVEGKVGDVVKITQFASGEFVDVQGVTRGRGFTGAIARWNFKIGPMSHGAGFPHRYQGSIAMGRGGSQAQRVRKGQRMSGHYGHEIVTTQNLLVLLVNAKENYIVIHGAIPGPKNGMVVIKNAVKRQKPIAPIELITKANIEEILEQNEALQDKEALHEQNLVVEKEEAAEAARESKEAK